MAPHFRGAKREEKASGCYVQKDGVGNAELPGVD